MMPYRKLRGGDGAFTYPGSFRDKPLSADESMAMLVVRALGPEAVMRLLLSGRYQWVWDELNGPGPR